ncbi:dihydrofolate reductase family protein [Jatrophihabitans fulvus]
MTRVRIDLNVSLDGFASGEPTASHPMGEGWDRLTAAWVSTRTFRARLGDTSGTGTTGLDDAYAVSFFEGVGAEIMGAGMFGLHAFPDDSEWKGWWGDEPPFACPVFVLTHGAPREPIAFDNGTVFHFRSAPVEDVLAEARAAAGAADVRVGGGVIVAREYLRAGLVDRLHVAVAPVLLGAGGSLWNGVHIDTTHKVTSEVSESGTVHVTFER